MYTKNSHDLLHLENCEIDNTSGKNFLTERDPDGHLLQKAADISMKGIDFADVKLLSSIKNKDARWVEINHIGSIEAFSEFCIKELTNYVDTDYVLLIQHDGFVLNPDSWSDEFLNYDYVGAPLFIKGLDSNRKCAERIEKRIRS